MVDVDKAPFFVFLVAVERLADVAQNEHDASGIFGKGRPALNVAQIGQNLAVVNDQKLPRLAVVRGRGILGGSDDFGKGGFVYLLVSIFAN